MMQLVLSLFPGGGLFDAAFEAEGFCVVRGPDALWGGDVRNFRGITRRFDGIIGGPPCQPHSLAARMNGTNAEDLIPEFVRVVKECRPQWCVMENVPTVKEHKAVPPGWHRDIWCDWDCGGRTKRCRAIWSWPFSLTPPPARPGFDTAEWSLCASQWKVRTGRKGGTPNMHQIMTVERASWLQGCEGLGERIAEAQPGGVSDASRRCLAIHMLGNGVPLPMGRAIAMAVKEATRCKNP